MYLEEPNFKLLEKNIHTCQSIHPHPVSVFSQYQFSHLTSGLLIRHKEERQSLAGLVLPSVHCSACQEIKGSTARPKLLDLAELLAAWLFFLRHTQPIPWSFLQDHWVRALFGESGLDDRIRIWPLSPLVVLAWIVLVPLFRKLTWVGHLTAAVKMTVSPSIYSPSPPLGPCSVL